MPEYPIYYVNNESGQEINSSYNAGTEFISRLAFIYDFNDKNILKLLYGTGAMFPSSMDIVSNKFSSYSDLMTENTRTIELNYVSFINSKLLINFSLFQNNLDNLISVILKFDDTGTNWVPRRSNECEMLPNGIELSLKGNLTDNFSYELGGIYQKAEDETVDRKDYSPGYSPNFMGYIKSSYNFSSNLNLSITGKFVDEMETLWDIAKLNTEGNFGARLAKKVESYFLIDAGMRINKLFGDNYFLSVRCKNIFNTDYLYPLYSSNSGWADKGTFGDSRKFMMTLGYSF